MAVSIVKSDMVSACCASPSTNSSHQQFLTRLVCRSALCASEILTMMTRRQLLYTWPYKEIADLSTEKAATLWAQWRARNRSLEALSEIKLTVR